MMQNIVRYNQAFREKLFNRSSELVLNKAISLEEDDNVSYLPHTTMSKEETNQLILCQEIKVENLKKMPNEKVLDERMMTLAYHYRTLLDRNGRLEPLDLKVTVGEPLRNDQLFRKRCYLEDGKLYDLHYVFDAISIHPVFRYYQLREDQEGIFYKLGIVNGKELPCGVVKSPKKVRELSQNYYIQTI